jgi:hypothetical protein
MYTYWKMVDYFLWAAYTQNHTKQEHHHASAWKEVQQYPIASLF